jgi:hypothetical protein
VRLRTILAVLPTGSGPLEVTMEVRDGFIVSVFNYCDRWCERCPLTSYCRLFADLARADAEHDVNMTEVFAAMPRRHEPSAFTSFAGLLQRGWHSDDAAANQPLEPRLPPEHKAICERALAYAIWAAEWLHGHHGNRSDSTASDPATIILRYAPLNASKIHRALTGLAAFDGDRECPPDHEGSAKVALLGLDRSLEAWRQLAAEHRVVESVARPCIDELSWIKAHLEAAIPCARAFVRPGFDEPDAVRRMLALQGA